MIKTLTITFEFDDGPWILEDTTEERPTDVIALAMDLVNGAVPYASPEYFVNATLDGDVLVDRNGYVSDNVKQHEAEYLVYKRKIAAHF